MKNIIITGGSDGLRKTIAKELSKDNNVYIISNSKDKLNRGAKEIGCKYFVCDVTDFNRMKEVVDLIGKLDLLLNCQQMLVFRKLI